MLVYLIPLLQRLLERTITRTCLKTEEPVTHFCFYLSDGGKVSVMAGRITLAQNNFISLLCFKMHIFISWCRLSNQHARAVSQYTDETEGYFGR